MAVDETTNTPTSVKVLDDPPKESGEPPAEPTKEVSEEVSPEEMLSELKSSEEKEPEPLPASKDEPPQPEKSEEISDSLGEFLKQEEPITIQKSQKHPDIQEGDVTKDIDGNYVINAQHVYDEIETIFGSDKKAAKLEQFFILNNAKPRKANEIAKICGFSSRHKLAGAIEELKEAKTKEDQQTILDEQFPDWTCNTDVEIPFKLGDLKKAEGGAVIGGRRFPWTTAELDRAVNDYVADNKVSKNSLLKSAKLMHKLEEYSGLSREGKPLTASEALSMVVPLSEIQEEKLSPDKQVSLGGGQVQQPKTSKKTKMTADQADILKSTGFDPKEFEEYLNS